MQWVVLCTLAVAPLVHTFSNGPPDSACATMFPVGHGVSAQEGEPLFIIETDAQCFTDGTQVKVTIKRADEWNDDHFFRGFFVQARDSMDLMAEMSYGQFAPMADDTGLESRDCFGEMNNAISHTNRDNKFEQSFTWTAPDPYSMEDMSSLQFVATVVHTQQIFWTFVESPKLQYRASGCDGFMPPTPEGEVEPEPSVEPESESEESWEMTDRPLPPSQAAIMETPLVLLLLGAALLARLALL